MQQSWLAAMRRGDYPAAWALSDTVLAARDPARRDDPSLPYHLRWVWDGREFDGRDVLVRCYHGLGDTLQFARYLAPLRARVASLTLEVQPELLGLLSRLPGPDRLIGFDVRRPAPPSACDLEIMELAHALRMPPAAAPAPSLGVTPRQDLEGAIGLCGRAGAWNPGRSIPIAALAPLTWGRRMACLQPDPGAGGIGWINPEGCPPQVAATAAMMAGLDLIITVDTMIAHLAGTLSRPTWLLLPHDADWRWLAECRDSPWYPTMRLYRQPAPGDWAPVLAEVRRDLDAPARWARQTGAPDALCTTTRRSPG